MAAALAFKTITTTFVILRIFQQQQLAKKSSLSVITVIHQQRPAGVSLFGLWREEEEVDTTGLLLLHICGRQSRRQILSR